jgi:hypothetical protein
VRLFGFRPYEPIASTPLEVGEHEDVEQLGAGSRTERVQSFAQSALQLVGTHDPETNADRT